MNKIFWGILVKVRHIAQQTSDVVISSFVIQYDLLLLLLLLFGGWVKVTQITDVVHIGILGSGKNLRMHV